MVTRLGEGRPSPKTPRPLRREKMWSHRIPHPPPGPLAHPGFSKPLRRVTFGWSQASPQGHPNGGETQGLPSKPPLYEHPAPSRGFSCFCRWVGRADHRHSPQTLSGGTRASKGWSRVSPLGCPAATSGCEGVQKMIARRPPEAAWPGPREIRDG